MIIQYSFIIQYVKCDIPLRRNKKKDEIVDVDRWIDKMHPQNTRRTSSIIYFQDNILLPRYVIALHKESETSMYKFNSDRIR